MSRALAGQSATPVILVILVAFLALFFGFVISSGTVTSSLAITLGLIMFILAIVRTDLALYFLILSMLLSPEISMGGLQEQGVSGGRSVVIRLDDLFLMLIAFGWLARSAIFKEIGLVLKSPLNAAIYVYTASFVIATGAGVLYGDVELVLGLFNVIKFIQYFVLFFMVINLVEDEKHAKRLINVALITAFIIALYAISQIPSGARISAPFEGKSGEPNTLGGYMLFIMSITLAIFLETKSIYRQMLYLIMTLLCLVAIFYSESRSSYIGLILVVIILSFYSKRRNVLFLGVIIALIFGSTLLPDRVIERISYTFKAEQEANPFQQDAMDKLDSSTKARLQSWGEAFEGWQKYPILGWGVAGYSFIDAQYMKILVETGSLGMLAFLYLMSAIYKNLRRVSLMTKGKNEFYHGFTVGSLAGFVGLCGHAIGTNTFIIIRIMEPFWLVVGIVLILPRILPEISADEDENVKMELEQKKPEQEAKLSFFG